MRLFIVFLSVLLFFVAETCYGDEEWLLTSKKYVNSEDSFTEMIYTQYDQEPQFMIRISGDDDWEAKVTLQVMGHKDGGVGWYDVTTFDRNIHGILALGYYGKVTYRLGVKEGDYISGDIFLLLASKLTLD